MQRKKVTKNYSRLVMNAAGAIINLGVVVSHQKVTLQRLMGIREPNLRRGWFGETEDTGN